MAVVSEGSNDVERKDDGGDEKHDHSYKDEFEDDGFHLLSERHLRKRSTWQLFEVEDVLVAEDDDGDDDDVDHW